MSTDGQGTKCHRNIAENISCLNRAHERYRQTDRRQTDGRAIAYVHVRCTFSVMSSVYANIPNKFPTAWFVSDIAIFVLKRDVKLQLTNSNCMAVLCGMPTIQYSDRSALLCALALYFVHLMRPKIQGLVSRDTIVDCQSVTAWVRE